MYLSSYVLASRSSDVSSQFGRLQSDQLQLRARGGKERGRPSADSEDPEGREPEGKEADFYANICETLRHGETTHARGMSTRRRTGFHVSRQG